MNSFLHLGLTEKLTSELGQKSGRAKTSILSQHFRVEQIFQGKHQEYMPLKEMAPKSFPRSIPHFSWWAEWHLLRPQSKSLFLFQCGSKCIPTLQPRPLFPPAKSPTEALTGSQAASCVSSATSADGREQGLANYGPEAKSNPPPVFVKKRCHWNTTIPICLNIVCGCFHTIRADLSSFNRDHVACKA